MFAFPDGTENEHIVISRVINSVKKTTSTSKVKKQGKNSSSNETAEDITVGVENVAASATGRKVVNFSKDDDLVSIVWTANRVTDLNISIDTCK